MDRNEAKALIPILQGFVDGGELQERLDGGEWGELLNGSMLLGDDDDWQYRLKPKPREFILELNTDGTVRNILERGEEPWFDGAVHIRVREVLEEENKKGRKPRELWVEIVGDDIYHIFKNRPVPPMGEVMKVREILE